MVQNPNTKNKLSLEERIRRKNAIFLENVKTKSIEKEIARKTVLNQLNILEEISELQLQLIYEFVPIINTKNIIGERYERNELLYHGLSANFDLNKSMILLIKNGFYGSARTLLRQEFELLLITKYNSIDSSIFDRWQKKKNGKDNDNKISVSHILKKLKDNQINCDDLDNIYALLCDFTHATAYAQQSPLFPDSEESIRSITADISYTTDIIYILQHMNLHLINSFHAQARGYFLKHYNDVLGNESKIKILKDKLKKLYKEYPYNKKIFQNLKFNKIIQEYKTSWNKCKRDMI